MSAMYIKAAQLVAYLSSIVELSFGSIFFATVNRKRREKTQTGNNFTVWVIITRQGQHRK
jgi:2-keto-4-pentenoate hydratase/2-oxohepta-3-ene-1,7-dioic acid hydratase in catechol pathway